MKEGKNEKLLETLIKIANTLNTLGVRVHGGEFTDNNAISRIAESLNKISKLAEDYYV